MRYPVPVPTPQTPLWFDLRQGEKLTSLQVGDNFPPVSFLFPFYFAPLVFGIPPSLSLFSTRSCFHSSIPTLWGLGDRAAC